MSLMPLSMTTTSSVVTLFLLKNLHKMHTFTQPYECCL